MITVKGQLTKKEEHQVWMLLNELPDIYSDFYITRNNFRLFIKENIDLLYECLKKGDKIAFDEEYGLIFVTGWSDNASRKYLKILTRDSHSANKLLKILSWSIKTDLYCKIKKNNPVKEALISNGFQFAGNRGKEILLIRKI